MKPRMITIAIMALGGQGGGVLEDWITTLAEDAGWTAQATSVAGVAQRTGATTYYVEVFPVPIARLGGRRPVFSLTPAAGTLDPVQHRGSVRAVVRALAHGHLGIRRVLEGVIGQDDGAPVGREALGDGGADAVVGAGDERDRSGLLHTPDSTTRCGGPRRGPCARLRRPGAGRRAR